MIEISIDGSCQPVNPGGTACYGYVIRRGERLLFRGKGVVGTGKGMTNNVAEYHALIRAIKKISDLELEKERIVVRSDSKLLINQMRGDWKVKAAFLVPLHRKAMVLVKDLDISFKWISREENEEADNLADSAYQDFTRR